jgi:Methyltransferase domain
MRDHPARKFSMSCEARVRGILIGLALAALLVPACRGAMPAPGQAPAAAKRLEVPYVPTPDEVVATMLAVARVGKDDVLYDLGSGDGRIVIAAARQFGTRGTGIDIDPQRIREADENARRAGVTDRVRFILGDIFDADISEATVVALYLLPVVNLRLRPKLLKELRPGSRIVSHDYDMGDWKPDRTVRVQLPERDHTIYYWVVPRALGRAADIPHAHAR